MSKFWTIFGIALGGFGSALNGRQNTTLAMINRFIDDDVAAQRSAIERDKEMLNYYRQQGIDLDSEFARRKADAMDVTAGLLLREGDKLGSKQALLNSQSLASKLQIESMGIRNNLAMQAVELKYKPRLLEGQARLQALQAQAHQQQMVQQRQANDAATTQAQLKAQFYNAQLKDPRLLSLMDEKDSKMAVTLPDGTVAPALDEESAKKARSVFEANESLQDIHDRLVDYRKRNSGGRLFPTADSDEGQYLANRARIAINRAGGLGALDAGTLQILEKLITDPSSYWTTDAKVLATLSQLQNQIKSNVTSARNNYIRLPRQQILTKIKAGQ